LRLKNAFAMFFHLEEQMSNTANYEKAFELLGGPKDINKEFWWYARDKKLH
jgi:hypothetical protein